MSAILDKIRTKEQTSKTDAKGSSKNSANVKKAVRSYSDAEKRALFGVLRKPLVTEKTMHQATEGVYVFDIMPAASKLEVKRAIEATYGVSVKSVRTIASKPVARRFGKVIGKTKRAKKALVVLMDGERLDLFEQVD